MGKTIKARFKLQKTKALSPVLVLDVAETPEELQHGLMDRVIMASRGGMLFRFNAPGRWSFWMKNTSIPLDVLSLSADGVVQEIIRLYPFDETLKRISVPAQYVLELPVERPYEVSVGDRFLVMT